MFDGPIIMPDSYTYTYICVSILDDLTSFFGGDKGVERFKTLSFLQSKAIGAAQDRIHLLRYECFMFREARCARNIRLSSLVSQYSEAMGHNISLAAPFRDSVLVTNSFKDFLLVHLMNFDLILLIYSTQKFLQ